MRVSSGNVSSSVDSIFSERAYVENLDQLIISKPIRWVFICSAKTGFSPFYLLNILRQLPEERTIIGRFGCIPTEEISKNMRFKTCHKYPILESGFAFTSDLMKYIEMPLARSEYSVGISLSNIDCNIIDDFTFGFLTPRKRTEGFLTTYFPADSSHLALNAIHASGLAIPVMLTPFNKVYLSLGSNFTLFGREIRSTDVISVECGSNTVRPPVIYSQKPVFEIPCFTEDG